MSSVRLYLLCALFILLFGICQANTAAKAKAKTKQAKTSVASLLNGGGGGTATATVATSIIAPMCGADTTALSFPGPFTTGVFTTSDGVVAITISVWTTSYGQAFNFTTSPPGVTRVIVAGGGSYRTYNYPMAVITGTFLHAPSSAITGLFSPITFIKFCYTSGITPTSSIRVTKTAKVYKTSSTIWSLFKTADTSSVSLSTGATRNITYSVTAIPTPSTTTGSSFITNGTISITNTGSISVTIQAVTDVIGSGAPSTVVCPVTPPFTIGSGAVIVCVWSATLSSPTVTTNVATVTTDTGDVETATATINTASAISISTSSATSPYGCVTIYDISTSAGSTTPTTVTVIGKTCIAKTFTYTRTLGPFTSCGTFSVVNYASLSPSITSSSASFTITVTVSGTSCGGGTVGSLTVTKTANTYITSTATWALSKSASASFVSLAPGSSTTVFYTVTATPTASTSSVYIANGTISIINTASLAVKIVNVTDVLSSGVPTIVNCGSAVFVPFVLQPGGTKTCTWSTTLTSATVTFDTATVKTSSGDITSATAIIDTSTAIPTSTSGCVTVYDIFQGAPTLLGTTCITKSFVYTRLIGPYTTCGSFSVTNVASLSPTILTSSSSFTIMVNVAGAGCTAPLGILTLTKTVSTYILSSITGWSLSKTANVSSLSLASGETAVVGYTVVATPSTTTTSYRANGTITVQNTGTTAVTLANITDVISSGVPSTVTCGFSFPIVLTVGDTRVCSWSATLPTGATTTNTATARTLTGDTVSTSATIDFTNATIVSTSSISGSSYYTPTVVSQSCVTVYDIFTSNSMVLGTACSSKTFSYSRVIGPYSTCSTFSVTNYVALTPSVTSTTFPLDSVTIPISVTGCTSGLITVTKTANVFSTSSVTWSLNKLANISSINLPVGTTTGVLYTVTATPITSSLIYLANGTITITNTGGTAATIATVTDTIISGTPTTISNCVTPFVLLPGNSRTCTWSATFTAPIVTTNTATVTLSTGDIFSATATIDTSLATPSPSINTCISLYDSFNTTSSQGTVSTLLGTGICTVRTFIYTRTIGPFSTCGSFSVINTVFSIPPTPTPGPSWTIKATVTGCVGIRVIKTVSTFISTTNDWVLAKSSDVTSLSLDVAETGTVTYTLTVAPSTVSATSYLANGSIIITNTGSTSATITSVNDVISSGALSTVVCPTPFVLAASATRICTWSASLSSSDTTLNTATITTLSGTTVKATAVIDFTTAVPIPGGGSCVSVYDSFNGGLPILINSTCSASTVTYSRTVGPFSTCGTFSVTNYAGLFRTLTSLTESDSPITTSSVTVTVSVTGCVESEGLSISKTASTFITNSYNWAITKTSNPSSISLVPGQTATITYTVTTTATTPITIYEANGTIVVTNNDISTLIVQSILDNPSSGSAIVFCNPVTPYALPPSASITCTWSSLFATATNGINNATAITNTGDFVTALAPIDFTTAVVTNSLGCVTLSDPLGGLTPRQVCAPGTTTTYTKTVGPYTTCGIYTINNVASISDTTSGFLSNASSTVMVTVTGCQATTSTTTTTGNPYSTNSPTGCPRPLLYWRSASATTVSALLPIVLGNQQVTTVAAVNGILSKANDPLNPLNQLLAQLLVTKLNQNSGVPVTTVASTINQADALIIALTATGSSVGTGYGSATSTTTKAQVLALSRALASFNNYPSSSCVSSIYGKR